MTRERLAALSRLSVRTVARIESGEVSPRADTLSSLAKGLGVPVSELFG